jgi:hypothetical protein
VLGAPEATDHANVSALPRLVLLSRPCTRRCRRSQESARGTGRTVEQTSVVALTECISHSISCGVRLTRGHSLAAVGFPNHKRAMPMRARAMLQRGQVRGNGSRIAGGCSFRDQQGLPIPHCCCRPSNHCQTVPTWPRIRRATQALLHRLVS